jgi:hypothetical protein
MFWLLVEDKVAQVEILGIQVVALVVLEVLASQELW